MLFLLLACADPPQKLPSEVAVEASADRSLDPPLYRKLYDYAFLPHTQYAEQRVRLRIWLRHMDFDRYQLQLMDELAARVARERNEVQQRQEQIVQGYEPRVEGVYDALWAGLDQGADDAQLDAIAKDLDVVHDRERELLELRSRSVRTLFDLEAPFLQTLSPKQETRFSDALFLLRNRLDPYANPGDFNALVGPVYVAGDFGTLTRTTFDPNEDHLNIGGLWSEKPETLTGPYFPDARREVLLYMVLLEPALPEALKAELVHAPAPSGEPRQPHSTGPGSAPPGAPGGGVQGDGTPAVPSAPMPGIPEPPPPGKPDAPPPGQP